MQVFDTHRLSYRSAKLRAWSNIAKTTPVTFYDVTDPGSNTETAIGTEVVTDSSGYLFYANGTTKVNCLVVRDPCIVEVSLDGGMSWLIQWITKGDTVVPLTADDIFALTYYDDQHNLAQYNPVLGPTQLPDYLRRNEFTEGTWAEGEIDVDDDSFEINNWTHTIKIQNGADANISVTGTLRAAQIITITAGRDTTLTLEGGVTKVLSMNHTYLWWWTNLFTDITYVTDTHIVNIIDNKRPLSQTFRYSQTDADYDIDQYCNPVPSDESPDAGLNVLVFKSTSSSCNAITLCLPNPTTYGSRNLLIMMTRDAIASANNIYVKIGNANRVLIGAWTLNDPEFKTNINLATYLSTGNVKTNAISVGSTVIDVQVAS